ncbi:serine/threonine-protein kinase [Actinomycetospora straminea]|uniref:Protein kinase domain-containing protein n=1 Tax=Actinomycetospora straminea TaxID=663607 RepID=A0ABP9EML5_9PSEU|nr:serine/threonine-protein kinase [Actinomycetospora straminea]MDD7934982.1 serine/threonine-protein kinase [Actinomycetospora straminea]
MKRFGQYELQSLIGRGGMGEVYLAHDDRRNREVALKLLPEGFAKDPEYERRFRRESYRAARLREPHVIPIHDYGEVDGRLFIDMRLVDGQDLATLLATEGPLPPERAVGLVSQVADALDAAHEADLIHRDVKPANILVTPHDFVYVADFGIAHSVGHTKSTSNGAAAGTLDYMAPERFTNGTIGPRTDVYSLACVLFECLTGTKPFPGGDFPTQMYAHVYLEPRRPSQVNPGVSAALDAVVAHGLAKDPDERYASAGELARAARDALHGGVTDGSAAAAPMTSAATTIDPLAPPAAATALLATPAATAETTTTIPAPRAGDVDAAGGPPPRSPSALATPPPTPPPLSAPATPPSPPARPAGGGTEGAAPRRRPRTSTTVLIVVVAVIALLATIGVVVWSGGASSSGGAAVGAPFDPGAGPRVVASSVARPTVGATVQVGSTPGYIEIAPSGDYGYIANRAAGVLTVFDTTRNQPTGVIPVPDGGPQFVAFSPDGTRAYVSIFNQDYSLNEVGVLDTESGTFVARVPTGVRPFALDVTPDGRKVYVPNHDSGSLTVIDTETDTVVNTVPLAPNPHWVDISPDGTRLYAANHESNVITTVDTTTDTVMGTVAVGKSPHSIIRHTTKPLVFNVNYDDNSVSVTDVNTNRVVATVPTPSHPQDITLSADGKHAYLATVDANAIQVMDTTTYRITAEVPTGRGPTSIAVSPDGRQGYATNLLDGSVTVINLASTA